MTRRRNLPNLGALRVFEAAARLGSFKDAAYELSVTATSVSHRMRALEAELGVALFERFNRRIVLTEAGRGLAASLTGTLDAIEAAVSEARAAGDAGSDDRLVVAGNPGLLDCWLRARLSGLRRSHPEITLELIPSDDTVAMLAGRADIALHFGKPPPPSLSRRRLWRSSEFPVCAPALAARLKEPSDLAGETFLHEQSLEWWGAWLAKAGVKAGEGWRRGPVFHSSALVIESAVAGDGVAMADELIAGDHLLAGRLVKPFAVTLQGGGELYLAWSREHTLSQGEERFVMWLGEELQAFAGIAELLARQEPFAASA